VLRLAFEPNIEMRLFNPVPGSRGNMIGRIVTSLHDFDRMQKRMHNKLFIADNAWGITGGRNLGDAYFGGATSRTSSTSTCWPPAHRADMSASFDRYWNDELAYPVQTLLDQKDIEGCASPEAAGQAPGGRSRRAARVGTDAVAAHHRQRPTVLPEVSVGAGERRPSAPHSTCARCR
jgi:putative cardiolipin synthase